MRKAGSLHRWQARRVEDVPWELENLEIEQGEAFWELE